MSGPPTIEVHLVDSLVDALVRIGFASSKREARYFITSGAVRLRPLATDHRQVETEVATDPDDLKQD